MSLKSVIKENLVLSIGILLPVLLIVVFLSVLLVKNVTNTPPQYQLLFSSDQYENTGKKKTVSMKVNDSKLHLLTTNILPNNYAYSSSQSKRLYLYDPINKSVKEITFKIPESDAELNIILPETNSYTLSSEFKSPDGYEFLPYDYDRGGSLMAGIFYGGGNHSNKPAVKNGIVKYRITEVPDSANSFQFLGWVLRKNL